MQTPRFLSSAIFLVLLVSLAHSAPVTLTERDETIPTYLSGPPDPNPMFQFGRESQGAKANIYPYPLYDNLTNQRGEKTYHLVYLENEFIKISIAPEIGGRLFSALDKTNNYDFVYHQHVIKPALIGRIGAWISGGIEWNVPHHHRASTFLPVQWRAEEHPDGSKTVWVGELEVQHRIRWAVGYTLHPGSSVLECAVRIDNRTPVFNSMLCFANVAVNSTPNYQIIFPPSTQWATYHTKNQFTEWPISHQRFNGSDFTAGVDISWYKNHYNSNSVFAWNYKEDFFAGYDHDRDAGTLSVADHHIVPGQKFFTWGSNPRAKMWNDVLTDSDGPYLELMVGAYSDNQPDYTWLQPFETRAFTMSWYPFRDIGGVKNANLDAAVNLEVKDGVAKFGFYSTRTVADAVARLALGDQILSEERIAIGPDKPYTKQIAVPAGSDQHNLRATLSAGGRELVAYSPLRFVPVTQPPVFTPPPAPEDIENEEELTLAGQRVDQFHTPRIEADMFWGEALRRDPGNIEANVGMARLLLRHAQFAGAEKYLRIAIVRLTANYTTPKNAEPFYHLGVALKAQGRLDEAFDAFYQATWSQEWKSPAYFSLAEIAASRGDFAKTLEFADQALDANALNLRAYGLKAAALRHLARSTEALNVAATGMAKGDPLDAGLMAEHWLSGGKNDAMFFDTLNRHGQNAQEVAAEFADAGLWRDGIAVLNAAIAAAPDKAKVSPMVYYYLGYFAAKAGDATQAAEARRLAAAGSPDYVFPFQFEAISVLREAMNANLQDARAPYYLGNLLFDWQPSEALALWEKSVALDPTFPVAWRNLAQAYLHQSGDTGRIKAIACLEKAVALSENYPTHFVELDQLYKAAGTSVEKRLELLEQHQATVVKKDEGRMSLIGLKTFVGKTDEAIALLEGRTFSIWENDTRFSTGEAWTDAHIARALQRLGAKQYADALADLQIALRFPANIRAYENAAAGARQVEVAYLTGCAHEALGHIEQARTAWTEAAKGVPTVDKRGAGPGFGTLRGAGTPRYYQALAQRKLGDKTGADIILHDLLSMATSREQSSEHVDAIGSAGQSRLRRESVTAHYVAGLGYAGLGETENARKELTAALALSPDFLAAKLILAQL